MNHQADEFILDIRRAARLELKPTVMTDAQWIDTEFTAGVLQRAAIWLTPKTAAAYDPTAFAEWPNDLRADLGDAVDGFRKVAATLPPDKPATVPQLRDGVQAFGRLKDAVKNVTLSEWRREAGGLIDQVEAWAKEIGWVTRRQQKELSELLLGEYVLDQLYMHAEGHLYIVDPIARFVPGGSGTFDLSIQPSFYTTSIYRHKDGAWCIHLNAGHGVQGATKEPMSRDALKRPVTELRSLL